MRIQKILEDANIKLASVLSSIVGQSGRAMLNAIVDGEADPERLAALAIGTAKKKHADLVEALRGRATGHHRSMSKLQEPQGRAVAQDHACYRRVGRRLQEQHLPASPVPSHQDAPRRQEGHPRRRGLDADRGVQYRELRSDYLDKRDTTRTVNPSYAVSAT